MLSETLRSISLIQLEKRCRPRQGRRPRPRPAQTPRRHVPVFRRGLVAGGDSEGVGGGDIGRFRVFESRKLVDENTPRGHQLRRSVEHEVGEHRDSHGLRAARCA